MATTFNTSLILYKGVPLLKGGVEVLYVYQQDALTQLQDYIYRTFTNYSYTRENRSYVRVKAPIQECEGCNYLSFVNNSHGNKIFFGFIDQLVYINDNTTEIDFTIDPFPTYLGDTTPNVIPYVIRKTQYPDNDYINNEEDFDFFGKGVEFTVVSHNVTGLGAIMMLFTCDTTFTANSLTILGYDTGIQYIINPSTQDAQQIVEAGGNIIGAYAVPTGMAQGIIPPYADISPTLTFYGNHAKLKGGQYNKISVVAGSVAREYDLMKWTNKPTIEFRTKFMFMPAPCEIIYPLNYEGVAENTAEGLVIPLPSVPISFQDNFTISNAISNFAHIASMQAGMYDPYHQTFEQQISSAQHNAENYFSGRGGGGGHSFSRDFSQPDNRQVTGGAINNWFNMFGVIKNITKSAMPTAGINTSAGNLILNNQNQIIIDVVHSHHYRSDAELLDQFFSYYGYSVNGFVGANTDDGAFLQTGNDFLHGSEVDDILNAYVKRGIKIRRNIRRSLN